MEFVRARERWCEPRLRVGITVVVRDPLEGVYESDRRVQLSNSVLSKEREEL
jgi:hypothetical protein